MKLKALMIDRIAVCLDILNQPHQYKTKDSLRLSYDKDEAHMDVDIYAKQIQQIDLKIIWAVVKSDNANEIVFLIQSKDSIPLGFSLRIDHPLEADGFIWVDGEEKQWVPIDRLSLSNALVGAETILSKGAVWQPLRVDDNILKKFRAL